MKFKIPFQSNTLGSMLVSIGLVIGIILFLGVSFTYIFSRKVRCNDFISVVCSIW